MALMASGSLNGLLPSLSAFDSHASSGSASRVSFLAAAATPRSLPVVVVVVAGRGQSRPARSPRTGGGARAPSRTNRSRSRRDRMWHMFMESTGPL